MHLRTQVRDRIAAARRETLALALACRDPRVPWYARAAGATVVAYALSPIDLIPDFIPVLGYVDDLLIIPAGVVLLRRLIPPAVLAEHRADADARLADGGRSSWAGAVLVGTLWLAGLAGAVYLIAF